MNPQKDSYSKRAFAMTLILDSPEGATVDELSNSGTDASCVARVQYCKFKVSWLVGWLVVFYVNSEVISRRHPHLLSLAKDVKEFLVKKMKEFIKKKYTFSDIPSILRVIF